MGRSGSTLLQRLLNVHAGLTIWGEHGGFLKGITEAYRLVGVEPSHRDQLEGGYEHRGTKDCPTMFVGVSRRFDIQGRRCDD